MSPTRLSLLANVIEVAKKALADAEHAWELLEHAAPGQDMRVKWVGAVAVLRAVGHVLDKVDGPVSPAVRQAVDEFWLQLKTQRAANSIFWEFIDRERNLVLKTYLHNYYDAPVQVLVPDAGVCGLDAGLFVPAVDGPTEGEDVRDTYRDALDWWRQQLGAIEGRARVLADDA